MEYIIKNALLRRSLDNVTVVVVAFENFQRIALGTTLEGKDNSLNTVNNTTDPNILKKRLP